MESLRLRVIASADDVAAEEGARNVAVTNGRMSVAAARVVVRALEEL